MLRCVLVGVAYLTIKVFEPTAIQPVDLKDAQEAMERNIARTSRSSAVSGSNFPFITYPDGSDGAIIRIGNIAVMLSNASSLAALFTTRRLQNALRGTDGSDDSDEEEDEGEPHDTPMNEDNNSDADSDLHPTAVAGSDSDEHSNDHSNSDGDDSGDVCGEPNPAAPVPADGMDRDSRGMSHGQDESEDEGDEQDLDPGEGSTRGMSMSSSAMRALSNVGERPGKPTTRTRVGAGAMWSGRVQASRERQRERERERQRHRGASGERRVSAQTRAPVYSSTSPPYRRPRATTAEAHAQNATDVARTRTDADDMDVDAEEVEHDDKP
ncbi:hypothetical protein SARC_02132 [Sphaeroforma arctica JP610]|uniref:Uncharacterized protein n=1 Tax=Sphaeroforma arctica JP610 TaxID=667725 RepID=A0A0L0GBR2_9EUKA|nr:hypothetical protein SARC_02132 [Sphaeroforma arctica JP610]KNC85683.1 hypothetical protein SARC_02132 [Sphaeroforma arctica JP610]|eukprot:XP_014159585.1 hypothetical protein SARC_02132 [Sphaeroforma arctica JP610]